MLTTREKFDIITSDPIHPWVKGAATLYTKEYFETVKGHLNPGGLVAQWVPLYESNPAAVKSELATFFAVFPNGTVWGNEVTGGGYDVVLLGQAGPLQISGADTTAAEPGELRARVTVAAGCGVPVGVQPAGDVRRPSERSTALAGAGRTQRRPEPAVAVPGGDGAKPVSVGDDLRRNTVLSPLSRGAVCGHE